MEALNFLMAFNYWPIFFIALVLLIAAGLLAIFLFARGVMQDHELAQLQKREAVLLRIKEDKDSQVYHRRVLLSGIRKHDFRGLV